MKGEATREMTDLQLDRNGAKRFNVGHSGELRKVVYGSKRTRFNEGNGDRLTLHDIPLKFEDVIYPISKGIGNDEDAGGHR